MRSEGLGLEADAPEEVGLGFEGGHTGAMLQEQLAALGIATDFVGIAGETRTNVSIVTADYSRHIKVNEPGPIIDADEQAALRERVRERAHSGDWWVLAGSLPPGLAPTFYATLINDIQAAGARVLLDTNGVVKEFLPLSAANSLPSRRNNTSARSLLLGFSDTVLLGDQSNPWVLTLRGGYRGDRSNTAPAHPEAGVSTTFNIFSGFTSGGRTSRGASSQGRSAGTRSRRMAARTRAPPTTVYAAGILTAAPPPPPGASPRASCRPPSGNSR